MPNKWDPLRSKDSWSELEFQSPGWHAFSPIWFERSKHLGVLDVQNVLYDNPEVVFLTHFSGTASLMQKFLLEHYDIDSVPCEAPIPGFAPEAWRFIPSSSTCP